MGTKKYLNHWRCQVCDWNSDRPAEYPANVLAQNLAQAGKPLLIECTRPDDSFQHVWGQSEPMVSCQGLMLLVGSVGEMESA